MHSAVRFDNAYREPVPLPGGESVLVRLLKPGDRARLDQAFKGLSTHTRYQRFHHAKSELTGEELRFFTNMDGWRHFALAACRRTPGRAQELVATARFVRTDVDDTAAEAALTIADDWQGKGIGKVLLARLTEAAAERGIQRLHFTFLHDNAPARRLLENCDHYVTFGYLESVIAAELHVPHEDQCAANRRAKQPKAYADSGGRPAAAPVLSPLTVGLSGFGTWMQHTRDMLGLIERWHGMTTYRTPQADAD